MVALKTMQFCEESLVAGVSEDCVNTSSSLETLSQPRIAITVISYLVFGLRLLTQCCLLVASMSSDVKVVLDCSAITSIIFLVE